MDKTVWKKMSYVCSVVLLVAALFFTSVCCNSAFELWIYKVNPTVDNNINLVGLHVLVALLCCGITFVLAGCSALCAWLSKKVWPGTGVLLICPAALSALSLLATVLAFLLNR